MVAEDLQLTPKYMMRDNDTKFTAQFDEVIKTSGAEVKRNTPLSPNLRAHVERFIQTLKVECLDKFVIVAERHLNVINREFQHWYNREFQHWYNHERPHSSRDHLPPVCTKPPDPQTTIKMSEIACTTRLGGLLRHYTRRAA